MGQCFEDSNAVGVDWEWSTWVVEGIKVDGVSIDAAGVNSLGVDDFDSNLAV